MIKKWIPPVLLGIFVFAGLLYWLVSKRSGDDAAGVHSNVPSTPADSDMVEEFGDGLDTEGAENTFEMSDGGKKTPPNLPEEGGFDESGIGQEMDGLPREEDDLGPGLGGVDGNGSPGGLPDTENTAPMDEIDTIDDDEGETLDSKNHTSTGTGVSTGAGPTGAGFQQDTNNQTGTPGAVPGP